MALNTTKLEHLRTDVPVFTAGDIVSVHQKIKEGDKERVQIFEGLVIARKHGHGINATFTIRKVSSGVGVERIFPVHSPNITKIELKKSGLVRQAKIYYVRKRHGGLPRFKKSTGRKK